MLRNSDESHLVEDRALERLGKLLSASASIFSAPDAHSTSQTNGKLDDKDASFHSQSEDLMSNSDTSSHLWQGIGGKIIIIINRVPLLVHNIIAIYSDSV